MAKFRAGQSFTGKDGILTPFEALAEDPDRETLARLLHAWHLTFGKSPTMVREAVERAHMPRSDSRNELKEVLYDIAEERRELNRRKLGWWIRRHVGRVIDGLRFARCSGNGSAEKWRVESVL